MDGSHSLQTFFLSSNVFWNSRHKEYWYDVTSIGAYNDTWEKKNLFLQIEARIVANIKLWLIILNS